MITAVSKGGIIDWNYGKDVWEEALTALLCGENLLPVGPKATLHFRRAIDMPVITAEGR